jgi:hypothetical protein
MQTAPLPIFSSLHHIGLHSIAFHGQADRMEMVIIVLEQENE